MSGDAREITLREDEIEFVAIRARGAGGQNIDEVSNAVHLRFDIGATSLPQSVRARLLQTNDDRISNQGVVVMKAQRYRSREQNRTDVIARPHALVCSAAVTSQPRVPTEPTRDSQRRRVHSKARRGQVKAMRRHVND